jgi:hypothetical protein
VLSALILVVGLIAAFGLGPANRTIQAQTTGLDVSPASQVVGGTVSVFVSFNIDPDFDPVISLSNGVWTGTTFSPCVTGIGSSQATIDDEACPIGSTTTGIQTAVLITSCTAPGTVVVTSSAPTTTSPSQITFTCGGSGLNIDIDIKNTNTNVIGIENENENKNLNTNTNTNVNNNTNTNNQDQNNTNTQTNNVNSSPKVNIDFD